MVEATKKTVKFLETRVTKEAEPQTFEEGKFYDLPEASAARWVARGVAEYATREPELKLQEPEKKAEPPKVEQAKPAAAPALNLANGSQKPAVKPAGAK